jgi:hypothetical protein
MSTLSEACKLADMARGKADIVAVTVRPRRARPLRRFSAAASSPKR